MNTYFTIAALTIVSVSADKADFPKMDSYHSQCQLNTVYKDTQCSALYQQLDSEIRSWSSGGPAGGNYGIKEEGSADYIWSTLSIPGLW
jgi:hypothetical protein